MTKKDYDLIALSLRHSVHENVSLNDAIIRLERALRITNPRFDTKRFLEACGVRES